MNIFSYFYLSHLIFIIGFSGILFNRKNLIVFLMSIELMLLSVNINFCVASVHLDDIGGQIFGIVVLTLAAAEAAVGLAILIYYYRVRESAVISFTNILKG